MLGSLQMESKTLNYHEGPADVKGDLTLLETNPPLQKMSPEGQGESLQRTPRCSQTVQASCLPGRQDGSPALQPIRRLGTHQLIQSLTSFICSSGNFWMRVNFSELSGPPHSSGIKRNAPWPFTAGESCYLVTLLHQISGSVFKPEAEALHSGGGNAANGAWQCVPLGAWRCRSRCEDGSRAADFAEAVGAAALDFRPPVGGPRRRLCLFARLTFTARGWPC
ncbi:hypothetical protein SKAU_G00012700 [Synaphobranchus kaupii]|uniref:Uncharacterized protein n=1 Tax=Synaphobranchus kaupii TaxID=118154 RepID=A0A9Q1GC51_SYNKA|nr:hypothetical protein SKAU_G00012700 [Synaphobranchus kaupii]